MPSTGRRLSTRPGSGTAKQPSGRSARTSSGSMPAISGRPNSIRRPPGGFWMRRVSRAERMAFACACPRLCACRGRVPAHGRMRDTGSCRRGHRRRVESAGFPGYIRRIYTDRDFAFAVSRMNNMFDPTVGVQRVFWSKNFRRGVAFSNGSHYRSPEADDLLERAAVEADPDADRSLSGVPGEGDRRISRSDVARAKADHYRKQQDLRSHGHCRRYRRKPRRRPHSDVGLADRPARIGPSPGGLYPGSLPMA